MKNLLTIFTLLFTVMIPSTSFAEWTRVGDTGIGDTFYVDFEKIKKNDGYVYYWQMNDYLKPDTFNIISSKTLKEVDCNLPVKSRKIYATYHTQPMGNGEPNTVSPTKRDWRYPPPQLNDRIYTKTSL